MAEQKKLSGVAIGLMAFLPWILYGSASAINHWSVATGGGLILCLVYLAVLMRRGSSIKLMDWTTLTFFVIASVLMLGLQSTVFPIYNVVVIWSCFAVAVWSSVAIGHPFTAAYARETTPPEFWDNPIFRRLNLVMTLFWCGLLTVNVGFAVTGVIIGGNLRQAGTRTCAADGIVDFRIRLQQSFPRPLPGATRVPGRHRKPDGFQRVVPREESDRLPHQRRRAAARLPVRTRAGYGSIDGPAAIRLKENPRCEKYR